MWQNEFIGQFGTFRFNRQIQIIREPDAVDVNYFLTPGSKYLWLTEEFLKENLSDSAVIVHFDLVDDPAVVPTVTFLNSSFDEGRFLEELNELAVVDARFPRSGESAFTFSDSLVDYINRSSRFRSRLFSNSDIRDQSDAARAWFYWTLSKLNGMKVTREVADMLFNRIG